MRCGPILHVSPYAGEAWAYGGIPRVLAAQVSALAKQGHEVTVATTDAATGLQRLQPPDGAPRLRPWVACTAGVTTHVFPNLSNRLAHGRQLFLPLGMWTWLRQAAGRFGVAHLHACHNLPGVMAAFHLRRAGVPYVVQPNGTAPWIERRRLAKLVFDALFGRGFLSHAARVIAVSEAERRQLCALGVPPGRVVVIPNPVEAVGAPVPSRGSFRARLHLGDEPLVVYLGQLSPRKRVDDLLRAVATLADTRIRLVIAGPDMGCLPTLRRQASDLGVAERTLFPGVLPGAERLAALADADVVAYPTEHEVFGLVPLEALLCGTPVVVCDDSGCGEVITRTGGGLAVPPRDPAALARALATILGAPQNWRRGARDAAGHIRGLFAPQVVGEQLASLYATLTSSTA